MGVTAGAQSPMLIRSPLGTRKAASSSKVKSERWAIMAYILI